jgi:fumarate reductase subunit C
VETSRGKPTPASTPTDSCAAGGKQQDRYLEVYLLNCIIQLQIVSFSYKLYHSVTNCIIQLQIVSFSYKFYHSVTNCIIQLQILSFSYKLYHSVTNSIIQLKTVSFSYKLNHSVTNCILVEARYFCLFPNRPDQLWVPPSPLFNGYRGSFMGVKWPGR